MIAIVEALAAHRVAFVIPPLKLSVAILGEV